MSGDDRGHDSDAFRALRSEIDQLRQELADVKQQATTNGPTQGPQTIKIDGVTEDVATEALQDEDEEVALEESTWVRALDVGDACSEDAVGLVRDLARSCGRVGGIPS